LKLLGIVDDAKGQPTRRALIGHINRAINLAIVPAPGSWTGPLDVFAALDGDCKAYGVAKYFALREAGLSRDDLRMIVVHVPQTGENHLVIAVADAGHWLMLDNLTLALNSDQQEPQYQPLLVMDYRGVRFYEAAVGH
jgi:predicted transglutaminase-like cysteine proteinase